ncbi:hypothetical protein Taro_030560 [Colocasia esculenta]|uniref:Uncharacterized protein n=1 Tax=Colocasia esculenta TaxID=4460 RepID=A0A843VLP9_COLES|nr:hypothetical protein [Colocasia esculenta]
MNMNFDVPYEDMVRGARSGSSSGRRVSSRSGSSAASGPFVPPPLASGTHNFFKGSVDTPHTGVDTMLQALSQKMKKWSSSVDTRSNGVDTRDLSQKACFAVLSCVSTPDEVVSTLETSPREVNLPVWDSVSTLDQVRSAHSGNFMTQSLS